MNKSAHIKKKNLISLIVISSSLFVISCSGIKRDSSDSTDSVSETENMLEKIISLPDTAYSSVAAITYKVEITDSTVSGHIDNLTDLYRDVRGSFTFRGDTHRNADFGGELKGEPTSMEVEWSFQTKEDYTETSVGRWGGGSGWTGQPLYVVWPDSTLKKMKEKNLVNQYFSGEEIIVGSLYGDIYFIDYKTGKPSRESIDAGNPIKGTPSLDPTLNGNLYVGQGVPRKRPFGALTINLFENKITEFFTEDPKAYRRWGAYDSSPLRIGDFLFRPGENGSIYKFKINGTDLKLHSVLRYTVKGAAPGIESSMAVYANYGVVTDNHGNIIGINLNTMQPVWYYFLGDDTDSSPVITVENDEAYVYVGNEVDHQGVGYANFVKLKVKNGEEVWKQPIAGRQHVNANNKKFDGGFFSSPLPGEGNCEDLIFTNCVINENNGQNGKFYAIEKKTGAIKYQIKLQYYSWSSPVGFCNENNKFYIVTGDGAGNLYLINGEEGKIITTKKVGANFESSPVVVKDCIVMGSRGNKIFKVKIK